MVHRMLVILGAIMLIVMTTGCEEAKDDTTLLPESEGPAYRSVHLFNIPLAVNESDVIALADSLNVLLEEIGYSGVSYRIWRVEGEQEGDFSHMMESTWPDQDAYDEAQANAQLIALKKEQEGLTELLFADQVYNRYTELGGGDQRGSGTRR